MTSPRRSCHINRPIYLVGLAFSVILAGLIAHLSLYTLRDSPALHYFFFRILVTETAAALILLPNLIIEDLVKAGKLKNLSKLVQDRLSSSAYLASFALAIIGVGCVYTQCDEFLAIMAFAFYPSALLTLVCLYILITSFLHHSTK